MTARDVVVGAGHNGLVAGCYLARAGRDVVVLERLDRPGGGSRTEETIPGYRFDLHSVAHNIINMTRIPAELDLAGAGLEYREMDPFSMAVFGDGRIVRFHRSVEQTVASIAEHDRDEAAAYASFIATATPLVRLMMPSIRGEWRRRELPGLALDAGRVARRPLPMLRDVLSPYASLLNRWLPSELTRAPVSAFAAHAGAGPAMPGGALYAFWQAAYHLFGQWHAVGGAQGLTDALIHRLQSLGGEIRCSASVARIEAPRGRVEAVVLDDGERIGARSVITAMDPKTALLELLSPPVEGDVAAELSATRRSNVVQALIHVATDRLPGYAEGRAGDWNGLQSYVDRVEDLSRAWVRSEAGILPDRPPLYAFTTSAIDDTLAPPGHHTVYLACPAAPAQVEGGWAQRGDEFVERCLDIVEGRAPGFRSSIRAAVPFTPDVMQETERWPGAHPMYLDLALDQLGRFRPIPALGRHRTPVTGLYVSGAGTSPAGGIAGTPGRSAARRVLEDAG